MFELTQRAQDFAAVRRGRDAPPHALNPAFRTYQKRVSRGQLETEQGSQRVVLPRNLLFCIRQKLKSEALFGAELPMAARGIHAHANDDRMELFVPGDIALEVVRLYCAARRAVFGIEVQHYPLASEIVQADPAPVLGWQGEVGSRLPDLGRGSGDYSRGKQQAERFDLHGTLSPGDGLII